MKETLEEIYRALADNTECIGIGYEEKMLSIISYVKELEHFKDATIGLYATDQKPEKIFEKIFVELIEEIGMDGEKTFSPMDYNYYRNMFNKGINILMFKIE